MCLNLSSHNCLVIFCFDSGMCLLQRISGKQGSFRVLVLSWLCDFFQPDQFYLPFATLRGESLQNYLVIFGLGFFSDSGMWAYYILEGIAWQANRVHLILLVTTSRVIWSTFYLLVSISHLWNLVIFTQQYFLIREKYKYCWTCQVWYSTHSVKSIWTLYWVQNLLKLIPQALHNLRIINQPK